MKIIGLTFACIILLTGCSSNQRHAGHDASTSHDVHNDDTYTCPMHPNIVQDAPGTCPICGMDLVRVSHAAADDHHIMLTATQLKLANVTLAPVSWQRVGRTTVVNAMLTLDEQQTIHQRNRQGR